VVVQGHPRSLISVATENAYAYYFSCINYHIRLLCLAADAGYINTDQIKFKIKQNTQIALRVNKIITKIFRNIRRKTA